MRRQQIELARTSRRSRESFRLARRGARCHSQGVQHEPTDPVPPRVRFAFWRGALVGACVAIPLVALAVWVLARAGVGARAAPLSRVAAMALLFAGVPAALTAGGVAVLAARALELVGPRRALWSAALAFAPAGAGLVLLAALPLGQLPEEPTRWAWLGAAGALVGAPTGAAIARLALARPPRLRRRAARGAAR
jgi:hypothetical protein